MLVLAACKSEVKPKPYWTECADLTWLTEIQKIMGSAPDKREIYAFRYKGQIVFGIDDCTACSDALYTVRDCTGKTVCLFGGIGGFNTCPDFADSATDRTLVYKNY